MSTQSGEVEVVEAAIILRELSEAQSALETAELELKRAQAGWNKHKQRGEILRKASQALEAVG